MEYKSLIRSAHPYLDCFDYDHYPDCFAQFEKAAAPLFEELQGSTDEDAPGSRARDFVRVFAEEYSAMSRRDLKEIPFRDKQVLALFLTPAALRAGGNAEVFARKLCALWKAEFPRNHYLPGNYETIMKGFDANLLGLPLRKSKKRGGAK